MQDNLDELVPTPKTSTPATQNQNTSLLKLRKNSNSLSDPIKRQVTIYYYDEISQCTNEINEEFNDTHTIGDIIHCVTFKLNKLFPLNLRDENVLLFVPKKKLGKPNEDYPYFRNEVDLKSSGQTKFAVKLMNVEVRKAREQPKQRQSMEASRSLQPEPPAGLSTTQTRQSYSNSLNKKSLTEKKQPPKKQNKSMFCFCGGNND